MDVGDILTYQAKPGLKRRRDEGGEEEPPREKKSAIGLSEEEKAKILSMIDTEDGEAMDDSALKKMILNFEKKVYKNQEMRIKYVDMPEKFMESELELHSIVNEMHVIATVPDLYPRTFKSNTHRFMESELELHSIVNEMHVIATVPDLYPIVVDLKSVQSLLQLLSHENTDISVAVVNLLQEMTDVDTLTESEEGANVLIDALLEGQVIALLIQNMERLDESNKEESEGVFNSLGIIENMTELRPTTCIEAVNQGLLQWIFKRIKAKISFDANKLYCSEILAILLQNHEENRQKLGEMDGTDVLLQQLAGYKRHDPTTPEEIEYMENLFNCMCSALMFGPNRERFLKGEGLQLMILMLREKKLSRCSAVKVLNHAMTGPDGEQNCQKFIDILGLRSIFPLFMKTPKASKKAGPSKDQLEEHIMSVISSLLRNTSGSQHQRLLSKFTENDHEKVDRLVELHFKYLEKVNAVEDRIEIEKRRLQQRGEEMSEELEEDFYMRRLDAGLFTLQLIDFVMLQICSAGASSVKQRVIQILNMRGGSIRAIKSIMREYAGNIGDTLDEDAREEEREKIMTLLDKFTSS